MIDQIFINLAVKDLKKTIEFFSDIGFKFNPKFTDEKAACMEMGKNIFAMLLTEELFKTFTKKSIVDSKKSIEALLALQVENKNKVNEMFNKAIKAGGKEARETQDIGFMYTRSFEDLDGHIWEVFYMDESKYENKTKITVEAIVKAKIDKVWEYWTEPHHIKKWNFASDDWESPHAENDVRTNGKFKITMSAKDKSAGFDFEGTYTNVKKFETIEYRMIGDDKREVKITFINEGNSTKIIETFDAEKVNSIEMQKSGWQSILNNFKKYAESQTH